MKKLIFFLLLTCGISAQAGVHRCGTYNIRAAGAAADTDERAWDSRKAALVGVLRDSMRFDIVGLNEVRKVSLSYLKQQLGNMYSFYGNSNDIQNQVLYRTDKYTLLDKGSFYLSETPDKRSKSWEDVKLSEYHLTVWVKLQDIESGEVIVFGSTHMSLTPIAIREGARVNAEQMHKIAGDNACIVTGDTNSEPNEHDSHANFGAYMGNARQMSKTEPQGRRETYIPSMRPYSIDAKLLDFLYVRNVEIEDYYTYSDSTKGRTLAPSDHQPVVASVRVLSPNREFIHNVRTVGELRVVCQDMQPNDIVYLRDGVYDLGDSSLYVANTCVIEGSKNAVLTGSTQLFSLPDYISLELKNLTFRGASCTTGEAGSILHAHGKYLKMDNCVIDSCSAAGQGLFYAHDCETVIKNCIFRNNTNEEEDGGVHIASSTGVDRYPLTMEGCLFEHNQSYYAPAVYFNSEATAYVYGNSFVENEAQEKGAVVFYSPTNVKDLRLVNNTFVNNRIDVMSGFMDDAIGGSAIWQEQSNSGRMTLMNNTIVGNYTACWESEGVSASSFPGGAVQSHSGELALYNNIIAGNYSSLVRRSDVAIVDPYKIKGIARNVFTSEQSMNIMPGISDYIAEDYSAGCKEMMKLFEGTMEKDMAYRPNLQYYGENHIPALSPFVTTYAGQNIAVLDLDAMSASMLGSDIMNMGSNTGFLTVDQMGNVRKTQSVPGSMEAGLMEPSGVEQVHNAQCTMHNAAKVLLHGQLYIMKDTKIYTLTGSCL